MIAVTERDIPMITEENTEERLRVARRAFLKTCGRFAIITPPAVTMLLSASRQSYASYGSSGGFNRAMGRKYAPPAGRDSDSVVQAVQTTVERQVAGSDRSI